MTVQELIYPALRLAQITKVAGRVANTYELADALATLNTMFDSWNTERLTVYEIVRQVFPWVSSQTSYTLGPDADWNAARPVKIEHAGLVDNGGESELEVIRDVGEWARVVNKSQSGSPTHLYYDRAFPATRVHLWPVPSADCEVALYVWQALSAFGQLSDTVSLPPGYVKAIQYNLAEELAAANPENRISPLTLKIAQSSKANIKRVNLPAPVMQGDPALVGPGRFDILTGDYR